MSLLTISPPSKINHLLRVLVVEDSPFDAELEIEVLKEGGFALKFQRVETQEEMEKALLYEPWDLIISDFSLPTFSGPAALEVLKQSGLDIPFIIISGTVGEDVAVASLKAGADDFLVKGQFSRLLPAVHRELSEAERRRAARNLEKKFLATFEQAAVGIAHVGAEGQLLYLNHKFAQILQYAHDALIGLSLQQVTHIADVDLDAELAQLLRAQQIQNYAVEKRFIRGDDSEIWVNMTVSDVWDESDQFDYSIVVIEDISQKKQAELALKESEERFRLMADQTPIIIWQSDAGGNWIYTNKRWLDFTGQTTTESLNMGWLNAIHPQDRQQVFDLHMDANQCLTAYEMEYRVMGADGEYHWIFSSGAPRYTVDGHFLGFVGTCKDFTDRKKSEESLQKYAVLLERSNKELEQFATIASHDLQEPLRKIQVFSDMLAPLVPEEGKDYIDRMQNSVKRMQTLITDLLSLSRVNRKGKPFKTLDLNQVVETVLEDMHVAIQEVEGTVLSEPLGTVYADEGQVRQLFQNLISNALKYHQDDIKPVIKISGQPTNNGCYYEVTVEDNGIGIAAEFYERIFEPFQRLHGLARYSGSGMGLAICKKITERHNGWINLESELEKGSRFHFSLPT